MKSLFRFQCSALLVALLFTASKSFCQGRQFQLVKKTVIGGEGGWDYLSVDAENRRLYVSHGTEVEVLNEDTHEHIGTIPDVPGIHGVLAIPNTGRGLTTNGRSNSVTIFDLKTLKPIVNLHTGKNPDALLYDKFSNRVFVFNHSDVTATALDIGAGKVVGSVDLGGSALEAGTTDGKGTIFVNLEDSSEIVAFDAKTLTVKHRWSVSPGEAPTGLAIDTQNNRLFTVCHNQKMMVIDAHTGNIVATVPIGERVDGVVFDPKLKMAFSSNGEGTVTVVQEISPEKFNVLETIQTEPGARTIALDPTTHHIFLSTAQYGPAPQPTADNPHPRPAIVPGTFMILEYGKI